MRAEEERLSLRDAADALGVSEVTARRWIKSGKLKAYQPGRKYLIPTSAIEDLLEEEVSKKAGAPSSRPYEEADGAEENTEDRIDSLQSYRESILAVVEKVENEFQELRGADSREQLLTLYTGVAWTRLGLTDFLEDEEIMQERTDVPEEEQRARARVWRAVVRFDDLAEDIEEMVDTLEEKPASVAHIADHRRQRAG